MITDEELETMTAVEVWNLCEKNPKRKMKKNIAFARDNNVL